MNRTYFYMRISTQLERRGQKYNRQEASLKRYAKEHNILFDEHCVYKEDCSGRTFINRIEWNKLESIVTEGDTIVFKDLSRFTREAENGYKKYMELYNNKVNLVFIDNPIINTSYIKHMMDVGDKENIVTRVNLENTARLLLCTEFDRVEQERKIIGQRISDGIKASGKKSGRKMGQMDKLTVELSDDIVEYLNNRNIKQTDVMRKHNISRNTLKKYIKVVQARIN